MKLKCFAVCAALFVVLSSVAMLALTASKAYTNPKLASGEVSVTRVCVMPAEAQLQKVGMKGNEGMSKESETWSAQIQSVVETELMDIGVSITSVGMSGKDLEDNEDLRQLVLQIQQKYDNVAMQMDRHAKDVKKSRYTLGDEVASLPCSAKSDSLVFIHGEGNVLTGGKKAFGALVYGPSQSSATLHVTFVDAKSGEVLAYASFLNDGKFEHDSQAAYGKKLGKELRKIGIGPKQTRK